jgi:hypothetical protein
MTLVQSKCNFSLISRFCIISIFQNELAEFKREFGHCNVPRSYERSPHLGNWCNNHRRLLKNGKLSQDRIDKLNELGFECNVQKRKREETHHNKSAETKKRNTDEKCKQLAKQIVDIAGEKASKLLEVSITERRLKLLLGERFSELEKLPSHSNLYRLRAPIEWEVDLLDCERVK